MATKFVSFSEYWAFREFSEFRHLSFLSFLILSVSTIFVIPQNRGHFRLLMENVNNIRFSSEFRQFSSCCKIFLEILDFLKNFDGFVKAERVSTFLGFELHLWYLNKLIIFKYFWRSRLDSMISKLRSKWFACSQFDGPGYS